MLNQGRFYLGHLGSIPLYVHWTFLFLVWMVLAPAINSGDLSLGLVILVVLLTGVVLHELGHGLMAKTLGATGVTITLWAFGGLCSSVRDSRPKRELLILAAGPAVSLALWLGCHYTFGYLAQHVPGSVINGANTTFLGLVLLYGAIINQLLFIFNMLPIYPLDGGQMVYHGTLLVTKRDDWARRFALLCAVVGAFWFLWYRTDGFTDFTNSTYTVVLLAFLLFQAYITLR